MAKKVLMIALSCVEFWAFNRPSMKDVVRLLEGTKKPQMPPNHFLSSQHASSNIAPTGTITSALLGATYLHNVVIPLFMYYKHNTRSFMSKRNLGLEVALVKREVISLHEEKAKVKFSTEIVNIGEEKEKVYGDEIVPFKRHIEKSDHHHGPSYLPLFILSLFLILFLKLYFDSFFPEVDLYKIWIGNLWFINMLVRTATNFLSCIVSNCIQSSTIIF